MEFLTVFVAVLTFIFGVWPLIGWIIVSAMNFISTYLKGENFFYTYPKRDGEIKFPQIFFGPLLLVWIFYPVWLGIVYVAKQLRYQFGWKVVTFNVRVVDAEYQNKILKLCPTTTLYNFFKLYMEDPAKKFYTSSSSPKDTQALTNFLEIDGWRKVSDVLYTKIVRVKDLNKGFKDE
jgi:hypothetical protein